jgi:hypothetical protein
MLSKTFLPFFRRVFALVLFLLLHKASEVNHKSREEVLQS